MDHEGTSGEDELYSVLADMVKGKFKLIDEAEAKAAEGKGGTRKIDADHPIVRAGYSLMEVYMERSAERGFSISDEGVKEILGLLDGERDSGEIYLLKEKYG